jgi:hypothetical protein
MVNVFWVDQCLQRHDERMDDAGPNREGDQAAMLFRISGSDPWKHPQSGVDRNEHFQTPGSTGMPCPNGRPQFTHGIDPADHPNTNETERKREILLTEVHGRMLPCLQKGTV